MWSVPHQVWAEVIIGTITSGGGLQHLAHTMGKSCTMELVLMEWMCSTQEAAVWGMAMMMNASRILMVMMLIPLPMYIAT